jgi:hypothetical protein
MRGTGTEVLFSAEQEVLVSVIQYQPSTSSASNVRQALQLPLRQTNACMHSSTRINALSHLLVLTLICQNPSIFSKLTSCSYRCAPPPRPRAGRYYKC